MSSKIPAKAWDIRRRRGDDVPVDHLERALESALQHRVAGAFPDFDTFLRHTESLVVDSDLLRAHILEKWTPGDEARFVVAAVPVGPELAPDRWYLCPVSSETEPDSPVAFALLIPMNEPDLSALVAMRMSKK